ncbi:MAG: hypothetical protein CVV41_11740 [Candidatus Riflebacteria bacterium HGW-Riflebacteria-1]|jgi:hypothetical protein|nr:MAG: hypothetical protein CVV41_11740 [Candidatus Riflebacteria bacterium HGW-Riflebacteria-1]
MMLPVENPEQNKVVEGEDLDNRPADGTRLLLFAALICSLPIYLLLLFLTDDPILSGQWAAGRKAGAPQQAAPKLVVKGVAGMDFASLETAPIKSKEELIKAMVCTFAPRSGVVPDRVYLRIGSFERFSATGMDSGFNRMAARDWPDFAFADVVQRFPGEPTITADLHFFCNFEERLPHPAPLQSLAGPLDFCSMRDGSVVLAKTIAVGDEFEVAYGGIPLLLAADELAEVDADSPYLALGFLDSYDLRAKAAEISRDAVAGTQTVFKIVEYLEKNGLYKKDYRQTTEMHPVKEFLLKSMTGYCQHFAAALVLLCRMNGIPARVAGGFASSQRNENSFVVVETMAHAWAEVLTKKGWKIIDVAPQRSDSPPPVDQGVSLPSDVELASIKRQLKKENARKNSSDGADKGGRDTVESDEYAEDVEPPRRPQNITQDGDFERAQSPETVSKDSAREERQQKAAAEKKRKSKEKERREALKRTVYTLVALLLLAAIIWLIVKNAEKWLKWLMKLLKKRGTQQQEQSDTAGEDSLREAIARMSTLKEFELQGKDVIALFNRFAEFMEARGLLPRQEHETPGEYFERLCLELNLRPADGKNAAQCFEAELYGGQSANAASIQKFLQFLQQILSKIS